MQQPPFGRVKRSLRGLQGVDQFSKIYHNLFRGVFFDEKKLSTKGAPK